MHQDSTVTEESDEEEEIISPMIAGKSPDALQGQSLVPPGMFKSRNVPLQPHYVPIFATPLRFKLAKGNFVRKSLSPLNKRSLVSAQGFRSNTVMSTKLFNTTGSSASVNNTLNVSH